MAKAGELRMKVIIGERPEMRPCMVMDMEGKERKAFFHCFTKEVCDTMSHITFCSSQRQYLVALVEFENGQLAEVLPEKVKFLDTKALMSQYCFEDMEGEK